MLDIQTRILGPEHPDSLETAVGLIGVTHCAAGEWTEAANAFAELIPPGRTNVDKDVAQPRIGYFEALAWLGAGNIQNYRRALEKMQKRHGQSENPETRFFLALTAALQPIAADQSKAALTQARTLLESTQLAYRRRTAATILVRCGELPEAIEQLTNLHQEWEATEGTSRGDSTARLQYFLALAHHLHGNADAAQLWLKRANDWVEHATTEDEPPLPWHFRLSYRLLRTEAEQLMPAPMSR